MNNTKLVQTIKQLSNKHSQTIHAIHVMANGNGMAQTFVPFIHFLLIEDSVKYRKDSFQRPSRAH